MMEQCVWREGLACIRDEEGRLGNVYVSRVGMHRQGSSLQIVSFGRVDSAIAMRLLREAQAGTGRDLGQGVVIFSFTS